MNPRELNRLQKETLAYEMRGEGKKYREIAEYFSVSVERARGMVIGFKNREHHVINAANKFEELLHSRECSTVRIANGLRNLRWDGDPTTLAKMGANKLSKVKNLGPTSIIVIAEILQEIGVINDHTSWLNNTDNRSLLFDEVHNLTGLSRNHITKLENNWYFPRHFRKNGITAWSAEEVKKWLKNKRIIRLPEVIKLTGTPSGTIRAMEQEGVFPQRLKIKGCAFWRAKEVKAWLEHNKKDNPL